MKLLVLVLAVAVLGSALIAKSTTSPDSDKKRVAALDTEYQAAVKKNDAVTMDRLLDDNFILVVGSGKVLNKADLIKSAVDKDVTFEHQEDTQQIVRVWG